MTTAYFLIPEVSPTNLMRETDDGALWYTDAQGRWVQANFLQTKYQAGDYTEVSANEAALWAKKFFPGRAIEGLDPLYTLRNP